MLSKVQDEITYPFLNLNGYTVKVFGKDKQLHPTLYNGWDYLSMQGLQLNQLLSWLYLTPGVFLNTLRPEQ